MIGVLLVQTLYSVFWQNLVRLMSTNPLLIQCIIFFFFSFFFSVSE